MRLYVHHVAGRLRLRTTLLARSPNLRERIADLLARQPGVRSSEINARAGSVLIHYDPALTTAEAILERVAAANLGPAGPKAPAAKGTNGTAKGITLSLPLQAAAAASAAKLGTLFGKALLDAMLHKGVERSVQILTRR